MKGLFLSGGVGILAVGSKFAAILVPMRERCRVRAAINTNSKQSGTDVFGTTGGPGLDV